LIDPWASSSVDYDKLVNQFGIQKFSDLIDDVENPHRLMKRGEFLDIGTLIRSII